MALQKAILEQLLAVHHRETGCTAQEGCSEMLCQAVKTTTARCTLTELISARAGSPAVYPDWTAGKGQLAVHSLAIYLGCKMHWL
jgi:hypothetical protein